mgnify:CR=1 FL=1
MVTSQSFVATTLLIGVLFLPPVKADETAEEETETASAHEVAAQLANPNASLGFLAFPLDYVEYGGSLPGADTQSAWKLSFQPSIPYSLGESTNLFVRPLIPLYLDQPVPIAGGEAIRPPGFDAGAQGFDSTGLELGDISFDVAVGHTLPNKTIVVGGIVGTLPTATDDRVGLDQYLLGPEFLLGHQFDWGFAGLLLTHQWDIAGEDSFDTSITGGQYFYTINLKNAWQIQATPTFSYNHEADSGDRLTFPVGVGVAKTILFGSTPWKFSLQYWHYVETPDAFGPDFQIRFQVAPVVPLPW